MTNDTIERMKKLIEEKKKKSSQQGNTYGTKNNKNASYNKAFKNTKRGGALNK